MPDLIVRKQDAGNIAVSTTTQNVVIQATPTNSYVLPPATASTLGGVTVGANLTVDGTGLLSANIPPQGVTAFNNRTGNVTLTANDVTTVANGIYQANGSYLNDVLTNLVTSYSSSEVVSGLRKSTGSANFVSGGLTSPGLGIVGVVAGNETSGIEFRTGGTFATMRIRQFAHTLTIRNSGFEVETGTANWTWSDNSILTQGRGDARYQNAANNTWANLTGKPTFATVATSGSYTDLANTPNLSLYLTTANAANTYLPSANFSFSNLTGKPTTLSGYGITDGLTTATAASTYQTISGMSSYLTISSAASTYLPSANFTYANLPGKPTFATVATSGNYNDLSNKPASYTLPAATNSTLGGIIVGSGLAIANGVLSSTTVNIDGGSATTTGTGSFDGGSAASN